MEMPFYPASRPLDLADKPLLDGIFAHLQPRISEFTFANLYLFREAHAYSLTQIAGSLVIMGQGYDGSPYFLPPLSGDVADASAHLLAEGLTMYGADETFVETYLSGKELTIYTDRDSFDYLHLRAELAELPGNRYHKKKNRLNYFVVRHRYEIARYSEQYLSGCQALLQEWLRVRSEFDSNSLEREVSATQEALQLAGILGLEGLVVLVEGDVKAFVLGERLNRDTSVCHFEKADPFLEGLYQLVDREFNRRLFADCTYVNREQDLGASGLRDAKLSYHPLELVKKFRITAN